MKELETSIDISAPTEAVWSVLSDFDAYPEWNPWMIITGRPTPGARLHVAPGPEAGRMPTFRPQLITVDPPNELRWLGNLWIPGLFDGEHRFTIEDLGDGTSRFTQAERFSGILARPILRMVRHQTETGFNAMNAALKERVESRVDVEPSADATASVA